MAISLLDLLSKPTISQVSAKILAVLQSEGSPITDWLPGAPERTRIKAFATALADLVTDAIPVIAAGGFVDYATGKWLKLKVQQDYNTDYNAASFTKGTIRLTCAAGAGPHTIVAGQLIVKFSSGNRYKNTSGGTLNSGGTLDLAWISEFANSSATGLNYVDPSGGVITLVTPLTGVTASNPAATFSAVTLTGTSTGLVTPTGTPTGQYQVTVRIDAAGQAGAATWSYSLNGAAYVSAGAVASLANVGGSGITLTLTNGATNPSFNKDDTFTFATPGTWITEQGTDEEAEPALRSRAKNRWPSLSSIAAPSPTLGYYDMLARTASSQVTQTRVTVDPVINNRVNIVVAGQGGVLPNAVITAVQDYIKVRTPITDSPVVLSPTVRTVLLTGVVTVERAKTTTAQAAAETAIRTYINTLVLINGTVRLAEIVDALMSTDGIVDVTGLTINGAAANLALPVSAGAFELASWTQAIATALTWVSS